MKTIIKFFLAYTLLFQGVFLKPAFAVDNASSGSGSTDSGSDSLVEPLKSPEQLTDKGAATVEVTSVLTAEKTADGKTKQGIEIQEAKSSGDSSLNYSKYLPSDLRALYQDQSEQAQNIKAFYKQAIMSASRATTEDGFLKESFLQDKKSYAQSMKQYKNLMRTAGAKSEWQKTILGAQVKRFPVETMLFFMALGAVNTITNLSEYSLNPLLMEQHFKSLSDPIGNISFLAFMIANGYAHHFLDSFNFSERIAKSKAEEIYRNTLSKGAILGKSDEQLLKMAQTYSDGPIKTMSKIAYMNLMPQISMTAGSIASHFTGDFLRSLQACTKTFTESKEIKKQLAETTSQDSAKDHLNGQSQDPCDVAWREWTVEKKFHTYAPAMASMLLSNIGAAALTSVVSSEGGFGKAGFAKQGFGLYDAAKVGEEAGKAFKFRFMWFNVLPSVTPGGAVFRSIKIVGHIFNLALFTKLDHMIFNWVEDKVLNYNLGNNNIMWKADAFPRKAEILYDILEKERSTKYKVTDANCVNDIQNVDCRTNDIEGFLYNYVDSMQRWKDFNKSQALMAHSTWLEMVNEFQSMESFTKKFYGVFIDDLNQAEYFRKNPVLPGPKITADMSKEDQYRAMQKYNEEHGGVLSMEELRNKPPQASYLYYPLYGVTPAPGDYDQKSWKDLYILNPEMISKLQQQTVHRVAEEFEKYIQTMGLESVQFKFEKNNIKNIITGLKSANMDENGKAILRALYLADDSSRSPEMAKALYKSLLNKLGSPAPLMRQLQGFTYGFEVSSLFKDLIKDVKIPSFYHNWGQSTRISFNKKTDYLVYHMLCGPDVESKNFVSSKYMKILGYETEIPHGFQQLFIPPKIVDSSLNLDICNNLFTFKNSNELYSAKITDEQSKGNVAYGSGAFQVLYTKLRKDINDVVYSKPNFGDNKEAIDGFSTWWEKNIEPKVVSKLVEFKEDYSKVAIKFYQSLRKEDSSLNKGVVPNSIAWANMQEARVYSMVLAEVIKNNIEDAQLKSFKYPYDLKTQPKKIKLKQDIITAQRQPYYQDFMAIRNGEKPNLLNFQIQLEEILRIYNSNLNNFRINKLTKTNGEVIDSVDTKLEQLKLGAVEKEIDGKMSLIKKDIAALVEVIKAKPNSEKSLRVINFLMTQIEKISREITFNVESITLVSQKALDYSKKQMSAAETELMKQRLERQKKQTKCHQGGGFGVKSASCE